MSELKQRKANSTPQGSPSKKSNAQDSPKIKATKPAPAAEKSKERIAEKSHSWFSVVLITMTLLAFITRVWLINFPSEVVFDEVHFGKFASFYLRGEYYFDVHPPLGKMLLAGVGHLVGYNGHFLFDNIGDDYIANEVPYIAFRVWCAICGTAIIPVSMLIMKEMGVSLMGCVLGAVMLIFDNGLITQSRLILLDSMLMFFCIWALYCWVKFQNNRHRRSIGYGVWVSIVPEISVKMVGLFTVATVGIATLYELWHLLDIRRGIPMSTFAKHFFARALCLIAIPIVLYLVPFYIHFALLTKSGPGDSFMTLKFQATLDGNSKTTGSTAIPYDSLVELRHFPTNHYLHSHTHHYPLRYKDDRVSSEGQQVNAYAHADSNSLWKIEAVDQDLYSDPYELTDEEKGRQVRYLRHNSLIRLLHNSTQNYLFTHDVASPMTRTNMEISAMSNEDLISKGKYEGSIWQIILADEDDDSDDVHTKAKSKKDTFYIKSVKHHVALHTEKKNILPEWGFKMQEMNGMKSVKDRSNTWVVHKVLHERIVDGKEIDEPEIPDKDKESMSFLAKFNELQAAMVHHNNKLTKEHPYSSHPISWPFVVRGVSFWEKKEGLKQIYLLSNPIAYWIAIIGPALYSCMWVIDRILLQRGIDDFGSTVRNWWDRSLGFLLMAWVLHYLPFFLMGRMLFLHHYMPAYIITCILTATFFDFMGRSFFQYRLDTIPARTPLRVWNQGRGGIIYHGFMILLCAAVIGSFAYFYPLTYGTGFPDVETLRTRKLLPSWDLQYA